MAARLIATIEPEEHVALRDLLEGNWTRLGTVPPDSLANARLNAHYAMQVLAAVGHSLVKPHPDDSHMASEWLDRLQSLIGEEIPGGFRVALRLRDLRLQLLHKGGIELVSVALDGKTLQAGIDWVREHLKVEAGLAEKPEVRQPEYELPEFAVGGGAKFAADADKLGELARWYANADRALQFIAAREHDASKVVCWPHHFDLATLLQPAKDRSIGIGMCPGDADYRQPYFYVTPWPYPEGNLPSLTGGGIWHRKGWTGAILTASKLVAAESADRQVETITGFLEAALDACRSLK